MFESLEPLDCAEEAKVSVRQRPVAVGRMSSDKIRRAFTSQARAVGTRRHFHAAPKGA